MICCLEIFSESNQNRDFLNAYKVPTNIRNAIKQKLKNSGRSLIFIYAPGIFADSDLASIAGLRDLTGITISRGPGTLPGNVTSQIAFPVSGVTTQPYGIEDGGGWSPWFFAQDPKATTLGTYTNNGLPPLFTNPFSNYSVLYSALPAIPAAFYRYYAANSAVHFFTDKLGDEIEAGGNTLLINTKESGNRHFGSVAVHCKENCHGSLGKDDHGLYKLFKICGARNVGVGLLCLSVGVEILMSDI